MRARPHRTSLALALLALSACAPQPLEAGDRDRVLTIGRLRAYGLSLPADFAAHETFKREKWFDGSVMVEYEFDAPQELGLPYLYSIAERHPSRSDACTSFSAGNLGARLGGARVAERNELFRYGDKSRFGLLVADGQPYGNYFAMCRGRTAFMVMLGGFYFEDGKAWGELLGPTLAAVDSLE